MNVCYDFESAIARRNRIIKQAAAKQDAECDSTNFVSLGSVVEGQRIVNVCYDFESAIARRNRIIKQAAAKQDAECDSTNS